ncbi:hypothetical protein SAMN05216276_108614 [Streptosporangium subroseum]|uniref:Uncharacterized protein n=1 Tax=Streptosporangium subroseum TaxID=106412 RepID=A0A239P587_9ACTN|nr:hypothetical protein [Streptosporangium subroseum]SNT61903.1 hypothetical protein SAMN05216276_108614 [Streptosporangium subroseum]
MTIVGVSGHQRLPEKARIHAEQKIRALLADQPLPLIGVSSLAEGADQLFVEVLLQSDGTLRAVVPCQGYETTFEGTARQAYHRFLADAQTVTTLDYDEPGEAAYDAAGLFVVEHCEVLVAIWDGKPARGLGGTADAVAHARRLGREVIIIWPEGVERA